MNSLVDLIKSFDMYGEPLEPNFNEGSMAYNQHGQFSERHFGAALGHSITKIRSRLAARIRQKISKFA